MASNRVLSGLVNSPDGEARVLRKGACVTLVGQLEVTSEALTHLYGNVGARTITTASIGSHSQGQADNQRANRLRIIVEEEAVELDGNVEVVLGSENLVIGDLNRNERTELRGYCGQTKHFDSPGASCRVLYAGDYVRVFGRVYLKASRQGMGSYRQNARLWTLRSAALACLQNAKHPECVIPLVFDHSE